MQPDQNKDIKKNSTQKVTIYVVIITAFITTFTGSALNLSIPGIGLEFGANATLIGWIINGYMLAIAAFSVPFGRLADLTGRRRILIIGILIFSISAGCAIFSWSMESLLIFRVIQGLGGAMVFSTNTAVLISAFSSEMRGKVLGYSIAATYIGLSTGPVLGGVLNHYLGWRSIFIFTVAVSALAFFLAMIKLKDTALEQEGQTMDFLGMVLYIGMIVLLLYGLSSFATSSYGKYCIIIGLILFVAFVIHERKTGCPIIDVGLFANNLSYSFSNLAALFNYGATFALTYLLSIYLQLVKGFDSQIAGFILISQPLLMALLSPYAGKLSDRVSPFKLASFGMALCSLGLFSFIFISESYPLYLIIINLVVVGIGFAFFSSPNTNAVMACVEKKDYGVASSVLATMRSLGHSASMAIVIFIAAIKIGEVSLEEAEPAMIIETMHLTFIILTCICVVGIFISLKRKQKTKE